MNDQVQNEIGRSDAPSDASHDPLIAAANNWEHSGWKGGIRLLAALSIQIAGELIQQSNDASFKPLQLTTSRHEALAVLYFKRGQEMQLNELGRRLMLHPTSVTSTVDALEKLGYVARHRHSSDRRAIMARITPAGVAAFETSCQALLEAEFGLGALTHDDAEHIYRILRKVRALPNDE